MTVCGSPLIMITLIIITSTHSQFVAHPNVQQLLASIWYEGLPGFRQKNMILQVLLMMAMTMTITVTTMTIMMATLSRGSRCAGSD